MAACKHKGRCKCSAPASVGVAGHWRELKATRRKKRAAAKPKAGPYWAAESSSGRTCGHRHRTASGALRCAKAHERKERANRARYLTRQQARKQRMTRWTPARVTA